MKAFGVCREEGGLIEDGMGHKAASMRAVGHRGKVLAFSWSGICPMSTADKNSSFVHEDESGGFTTIRAQLTRLAFLTLYS
jgi:hypothetical protein